MVLRLARLNIPPRSKPTRSARRGLGESRPGRRRPDSDGEKCRTASESIQPDMSPVWYRSANRCSLMPDTPAGDSNHVCQFRRLPGRGRRPAPNPAAALDAGISVAGGQTTTGRLVAGARRAETVFQGARHHSQPAGLHDWPRIARRWVTAGRCRARSTAAASPLPRTAICWRFHFRHAPARASRRPTRAWWWRGSGGARKNGTCRSCFTSLSGLNDQSGLLWNDNGERSGSSAADATWARSPSGSPPAGTAARPGAPCSRRRSPARPDHLPRSPSPALSAARTGPFMWPPTAKAPEACSGPAVTKAKRGRTPAAAPAGRHTTFVLLKDGRILGMGGKDSSIAGYLPRCYSADFGKTWSAPEKTPFAALGSNQRPKILRLASGRLFFAGDFQNIRSITSPPPDDIKERGAYVALSDDEGADLESQATGAGPAA